MTRGQIVPRDTPENEGWLFAQSSESPALLGSPDPSRTNSNPLLPIISGCMGSVGTQDKPSPKGGQCCHHYPPSNWGD